LRICFTISNSGPASSGGNGESTFEHVACCVPLRSSSEFEHLHRGVENLFACVGQNRPMLAEAQIIRVTLSAIV
jgi:hypothetical protein